MRCTATDRVYLDRELKRTNWLTRFEHEVQQVKRNWTCCLLSWDTMNLLMFSLTCPLISNALPPMASDGDRFLAKSCPGLKHLQRALGTHFAKLNHCEPYNHDLWSRWVHAFSGGVMAMVGKLIDSSNDSRTASRRSVCFLVSCTRAGAHHCMTSWEASAGWLTMGLSTRFIGIFTCINSFETIWKLPVLKYNLLKPTQIVVICCKETGFDDWLTRSWLNLSNIWSALGIVSSTVACRMALHDMPNPHVINHANCLSWAKGSQTKTANIFSIRFLGPLCHASWLGGYAPDLEENSFPFLAIAIKELTFKRSVQQ